MFDEITSESGCRGEKDFGDAPVSPAAATVIGARAAPVGTVTVNSDVDPEVTFPSTPPNRTTLFASVEEKVPESVTEPPTNEETGVNDVIAGRKPFPERVTESGVLDAFEANTRAPVFSPVALGANVTENTAESPGEIDALDGETEKAVESIEADEIESVIDPPFETVTLVVWLRFTPTSPNEIDGTDKANATYPPNVKSPKLVTVAVTFAERKGLETMARVDGWMEVQDDPFPRCTRNVLESRLFRSSTSEPPAAFR